MLGIADIDGESYLTLDNGPGTDVVAIPLKAFHAMCAYYMEQLIPDDGVYN